MGRPPGKLAMETAALREPELFEEEGSAPSRISIYDPCGALPATENKPISLGVQKGLSDLTVLQLECLPRMNGIWPLRAEAAGLVEQFTIDGHKGHIQMSYAREM